MMNRPIEFRAYHAPTGSLFPILYFTEYEVFKHEHHAFFLDECVLMQFTGLYDSQGKKVFEGDVLYSFFPSDQLDNVSTEYWRVITFQAGGFCELANINEVANEIETMWLSQYCSAHQDGRLEDRIVDCYYLRSDLLNLNTESAEVPASFD